MNKSLYIILFMALLSLSSCEREDDIEEIFNNKVWYMNGKTFNGLKANGDVINFYPSKDDTSTDRNNIYLIQFGQNSFDCILSKGLKLSGTWNADGKKQSITLTFKEKPTNLSTFDREAFEILSSATKYRSGADYLSIQKDKNNKLTFGLIR